MKFIWMAALVYGVMALVIGGWAWLLPAEARGNEVVWFTDAAGARCDSRCLFGIVPGQTTITDARARLKAHPITRDLRTYTVDMAVHFEGDGLDLSVLSDGHGWVSNFWMTVDASAVTFADVLLTLGPPTIVEFALHDTSQGFVSWYYATQAGYMVVTGLQAGLWFDPRTPVQWVETTPESGLQPMIIMTISLSLNTYSIPAWHGFGYIHKYLGNQTCQPEAGRWEVACSCREYVADPLACLGGP